MAITNIIERTVDIDVGILHEDLHRLFAVADAQAHTFKITVMSKGQAQSLSGHTVIGYFMTNYHGTVVINGSVSGNVATLTLPAACYANNTGFQLIIRIVSGSTKTSIYWGSGYVSRSASNPTIDPGSVIPNIDDLLAKINEMEQATQAANAAATNANTAAEKSIRYDTVQSITDAQKLQARNNIGAAGAENLAPVYAQTTYAVGDMVTQGGKLYKCTTAITAAETWTAGHWIEVAVSDEITDLKDDLSNVKTTAIGQRYTGLKFSSAGNMLGGRKPVELKSGKKYFCKYHFDNLTAEIKNVYCALVHTLSPYVAEIGFLATEQDTWVEYVPTRDIILFQITLEVETGESISGNETCEIIFTDGHNIDILYNDSKTLFENIDEMKKHGQLDLRFKLGRVNGSNGSIDPTRKDYIYSAFFTGDATVTFSSEKDLWINGIGFYESDGSFAGWQVVTNRSYKISSSSKYTSDRKWVILLSKPHYQTTDVLNLDDVIYVIDVLETAYLGKELSSAEATIDNLKQSITGIAVNVDSNTSSIENLEQTKLTKGAPSSITVAMLADETKDYIGSHGGGGGGGDGYSPDFIDISLNDDSELQFADKIYGNGLGKKYLRENIVSGTNTISSDMLMANAINIIRQDYVITSVELRVPQNAILLFDGGSLSNGTLIGNNTSISAPGANNIFRNVVLEGTFSVLYWLVDWFGDCEADASIAISNGIKALNHLAYINNPFSWRDNHYKSAGSPCLHFGNRTYHCKTQINLTQYENETPVQTFVYLSGNGKGSIIVSDYDPGNEFTTASNCDYLFVYSSNALIELRITDLTFAGKYGYLSQNHNQGCFKIENGTWINNGEISRCYFCGFASFICFLCASYWLRLESNIFNQGKQLVYLTGINSTSITNNSFRSTSGDYLLILDGTSQSVGSNISGNDFSGALVCGLLMKGNFSSVAITGNYFEAQVDSSNVDQAYDLMIGDGLISSSIEDCIIKSNAGLEQLQYDSTYNHYKHAGIVINGTVKNCDINGYIVNKENYNGYGNHGNIAEGVNGDLSTIKNIFSWYINKLDGSFYRKE